jgi:hypothetical protein
MASTTENAPKDATEDPKLDVFEDDDEFEEFENDLELQRSSELRAPISKLHELGAAAPIS